MSSEYQDSHREVPWREVVGMRNRLVHEYFRILPRRVWDVVEKDIPKLIEVLESLVPEENEGEGLLGAGSE